MKLRALRLHNVKRFAGRGVAIENIADGVNVLCAANEFGKSTSFEALHGLFFLPYSSTAGEVRNLRPYSGGNPLVEADIAVGDDRYRISKQFYGNRFVRVSDLATGRLIAQADEAENFIAGLVHGGAGGPAGLLWVRQGITGIERRSRSEEDSERQVRTSLLESVQGEVEAVTGGRRMAEIMAKVLEASAELVTPTGRAKAGGRYSAAVDLRDQLSVEELRLAEEVRTMREELDRRSTVRRRLAKLESADAQDERRRAVQAAEYAFEAARAKADKLKTAEAQLELARELRDTAEWGHRQFAQALVDARQVEDQTDQAKCQRDEAVERRRTANATISQARIDAESAEAGESGARELLAKLDGAAKARDAAARRAENVGRLQQAEAIRGAIETCEAQLTHARLPNGSLDQLAELDIEIAQIRAVEEAARPSVMVEYEGGTTVRMTLDEAILNDGEERTYSHQARLVAPGVGTITLHSIAHQLGGGRLEKGEARRNELLASMGVTDLPAARARQVLAQGIETKAAEARAQMTVLAPDGLDALRHAVTALGMTEPPSVEFEADPDEVRLALEAAEGRRRAAVQSGRAAELTRSGAEKRFVAAETLLAKLQTRAQQIDAVLGPVEDRNARGLELKKLFDEREGVVAEAQQTFDAQSADTLDIDAVDAALKRVRSVERAAETEIQQLREALAGLNARIGARSEDAVEEAWRETAEALATAQGRVTAFEHEIAVLTRLTRALETARSHARDLYLRPVMNELRPLLGLLFDDVAITFDDRTLLPQSIVRGGQEEEVDRLSGGMREQLSVLTRLAFARLLARDGRPAPVILDDALVYSDDDRIERMFDALHRQAQDQQIIVFSCRQRAFQKLGGNVMQMTSWLPSDHAK